MEAQHLLRDGTKDYLLSISFNSHGTSVPPGAPRLQLLFALQVLPGRAWICSRVTYDAGIRGQRFAQPQLSAGRSMALAGTEPSPSPIAHLFPGGLYGIATPMVFPGEFVGMGWFWDRL